MAANWEKKGDTEGVLTFEIAQDKIKKGLDQAFNRVKKNLNVPGFRKGHVSRTVFDHMYGESALYEDALNIVMPSEYDAAVKEAGIDPVDQPKVDIDSMDEGKPWVLKPPLPLPQKLNWATTRVLKLTSRTLPSLTKMFKRSLKTSRRARLNSYSRKTARLKRATRSQSTMSAPLTARNSMAALPRTTRSNWL